MKSFFFFFKGTLTDKGRDVVGCVGDAFNQQTAKTLSNQVGQVTSETQETSEFKR